MTEKQERECRIFEAFLRIEPAFAGEELAEWSPPEDEKDFPDIQAVSVSGRRVGVELGEWLHQGEMTAAKTREFIETSMRTAIGEQGPNRTQHIRYVWLHPRPKARIKPSDIDAFRAQLFECIIECDRRWPGERYWQGPAGARLTSEDLAPYPMLNKYLDAMKLWPSDDREPWADGLDWITFPLHGDVFSKETMLNPLRDRVSDKINHYAVNGYDHLSLLIYYGQAAIYNSPVETPLHSFDDAALELARFVDGDLGPFQSLFLFIWLGDGRVIRIASLAVAIPVTLLVVAAPGILIARRAIPPGSSPSKGARRFSVIRMLAYPRCRLAYLKFSPAARAPRDPSSTPAHLAACRSAVLGWRSPAQAGSRCLADAEGGIGLTIARLEPL